MIRRVCWLVHWLVVKLVVISLTVQVQLIAFQDIIRVQSASIGFVNFVVPGSHWMMDQRQLSCMLLLRLASTTAIAVYAGAPKTITDKL